MLEINLICICGGYVLYFVKCIGRKFCECGIFDCGYNSRGWYIGDFVCDLRVWIFGFFCCMYWLLVLYGMLFFNFYGYYNNFLRIIIV